MTETPQTEAPQAEAPQSEASQAETRVVSWVLEHAREPTSADAGSSSQSALPEIDTSVDSNDCLIPERRKVAIIGGGISGFAAYWSLRETNHSVELFEETDNLAGFRNPVSVGSYPNFLNIDRSFMNFFPIASR